MQPTTATTTTMAIKKTATKTIKKAPKPTKQTVPKAVTRCERKKKRSVSSSTATATASSSSSESEPEKMKKEEKEDAPMEETVAETEFEDPHEMCIFDDAEAFFERRTEWETEPEKEKVCREWESSEGARRAEDYYFRIFGEQL